MEPKKLLMIVNPRAGKTKPAGPLFGAAAALSEQGYLLSVRPTKGQGHARAIAAVEGAKFDVVVAVGGDGTLNEVAAGLMTLSSPPPLGYFPQGSTNDFAASLKISGDPEEAVQAVLRAQPRQLDVGMWNERSFVYVASFGAFTRSSYSAPQSVKNALGHLAYILEGVKDLDTLRPYRIRLTADGEVLDGEYLFGAVCNSTSMGGLLKLKPGQVDFADGLFELMLIRYPESPADLVRILQALTTSRFENVAGISFRHCREASFRLAVPTPWTIDGEFGGKVTEVTVQNLHNVIRMIM